MCRQSESDYDHLVSQNNKTIKAGYNSHVVYCRVVLQYSEFFYQSICKRCNYLLCSLKLILV